MNALALHLPERQGYLRWLCAATIVLAAHAAIIAPVVLWHARQPVAPNIIPAIAVTLAPVEASAPEIPNQDIAVGPAMQQAEASPKPPPKIEENPPELVMRPPPQPSDVTLPSFEKQTERPTPEFTPPAPDTRAPAKTERLGQFTEAGSNAYNALVLGHLQRFKRYPLPGRGPLGIAVVRFVLNRAGEVIETEVTKSSGSRVLDQEALAIIRRASPFPPFPAAKPGAKDIYIAPLNFSR